MKPPESYAEWSDALTTLEMDDARDGEILPALEAGKISWGPGVAERFPPLLAAVFNARLKRIAQNLQRDLADAGGQETPLAAAALNARRRLATLARLAGLPALLPAVRDHFRTELEKFASRTQASLEQSAGASDPAGRLRAIFRRNPLTAFSVPSAVPAAPPAKEPAAGPAFSPAFSGRRIILK